MKVLTTLFRMNCVWTCFPLFAILGVFAPGHIGAQTILSESFEGYQTNTTINGAGTTSDTWSSTWQVEAPAADFAETVASDGYNYFQDGREPYEFGIKALQIITPTEGVDKAHRYFADIDNTF